MKKIIAGVLLPLFMLLSACGGQLASVASGDQAEARKDSEDRSTSEPLSTELISSPAGIIYTGPACTDQGFYEVLFGKDVVSGAENITFTDYETCSRIYLSSNVNSSHQDESDTSYIPSLLGGYGIVTDKRYLYILKLGKPGLADLYGETGLTKVYRLDLDGNNRKEFTFKANEEIMPLSGVVSDGRNLYLEVYTIDSDTTTHLDLVKINFETQSSEMVYSLDEFYAQHKSLYLAGAKNDKLLFLQYETNEENETVQNFYKICISNPYPELVLQLNLEKACPILCDGTVYYFDLTKDSFYKFDLGTEKEMLLASNFSPKEINFDGVRAGRHSIFPYFFFEFSNQGSDEIWRYAWDMENRVWHEETLTDGDHDVSVWGEKDDCFLVKLQDKAVSYQDYSPNGDPFQNTMNVEQYALIKKRDYWDGRADYILFDDMIYD